MAFQAISAVLPDEIWIKIFANVPPQTRVTAVPLTCWSWHRLAQQPAAWPDAEILLQVLCNKMGPGSMPSFLRWVGLRASGIERLTIDAASNGPGGQQHHVRSTPQKNCIMTGCLSVLSCAQPSQLRLLRYYTACETGTLQCLLNLLDLFPNLEALTVSCDQSEDRLNELDWSHAACLQKLQSLQYIALEDVAGDAVTPAQFWQLTSLTDGSIR
ncbi:hypothetical protein WJX72_009765 [[Myrmecia] bisecta]|uniref:F-box domain-containing protein n=1 Tax=[Myrmecia] bisecta TaxID=41462 RepID=A0AAW1R903_9CHLO